ncbi:hypothetical protein [Streptomyces phaeochromogenes]
MEEPDRVARDAGGEGGDEHLHCRGPVVVAACLDRLVDGEFVAAHRGRERVARDVRDLDPPGGAATAWTE